MQKNGKNETFFYKERKRTEKNGTFFWKERMPNPAGMTLYVSPNPNFQCMRVKVYIFNKFQGAQILLFFCENWHKACFYIKKHTQKYIFEIWLLKSNILDPQIRVGKTFFSKECNVLAFFCVLYKRTLRSLCSFTLFIKECGILCILLRS